MSAHTPGPWQVCQSYTAGRLIVQAPQPTNRVLAGFGSEDEPLDDTDVANARLIAAAPELLSSLKALHSICTRCDLDEPHPDAVTEQEYQQTMDEVEASIAKAEGQ